MKGKSVIRKINYQTAKAERAAYFLNLSPAERVKYLQHLRKLNLGNVADEPIKKIISVISRNPDKIR
jgi:hypothetical protein